MRTGPESGAERPPRLGMQAPGVHSGCPKHTETGLVMANCGQSPGRPELSRDLSPTRVLLGNRAAEVKRAPMPPWGFETELGSTANPQPDEVAMIM